MRESVCVCVRVCRRSRPVAGTAGVSSMLLESELCNVQYAVNIGTSNAHRPCVRTFWGRKHHVQSSLISMAGCCMALNRAFLDTALEA